LEKEGLVNRYKQSITRDGELSLVPRLFASEKVWARD